MTNLGGRRREPERRDEEDERGPLISSENDEPAGSGRSFDQLEDWQKPRELPASDRARRPKKNTRANTEGQRSRAGRSAR
jgi:hypothetical protein